MTLMIKPWILVLPFLTFTLEAKSESPTPESNAIEIAKLKDERTAKFNTIGFDLGLGAESYRDTYISNATIGADNIVRVTESYDYQPSLWLQFSWLTDRSTDLASCGDSACVGIAGVYTGVKIAGQNSTSLDALSLGLTFASFRLGEGDSTQTSAIKRFYIGFGPVIHKTRALANGIVAGQPLPSELKQIEYEESYETSWMLMIGVRL